MKTCYITVSDIALCQRCPALLAYKLHRKQKSAWTVGINGSEYYGSIFHKNIAQEFFEAAYNDMNPLHDEIIDAVKGSPEKLENLIREKIFLPFAAMNSGKFTANQLLAVASGIKIWVKAMSEFFSGINSHDKIFIKPEQDLQGIYTLEYGYLSIRGRYDALLFNPDKGEVRLFEFKAYNKTDITVPLAQSLVYAWLIAKKTGITPSIEIIYLDEKSPDIFDSVSVAAMIKSNLPDLFNTVWQVISLKSKKFPEIRGDKKLCAKCKYKYSCERDRAINFRSRRGASLVSLLVFFLTAALIMTQVFFFSVQSFESLTEDREIMGVRLGLENLITQAKEYIKHNNPSKSNPEVYFYEISGTKSFYEGTRITETGVPSKSGNMTVNIHDLNYHLLESYTYIANEGKYNLPEYERLFPAMPGKFLIRAYAPVDDNNNLMIQEVVSNDVNATTIFHQEVWY